MAPQTRQRTKVFISYCRKDGRWLKRLDVHLSPLKKPLDVWHDGRIEPGDKWRKEITDALGTTKVAVLLVSADFLASEFIKTVELPSLLKDASDDETKILIINAAPSMVDKHEELSQYQAVNDPEWPLIRLSSFRREQVFCKTAYIIRTWFEHTPPPPP